MYRKTLDVHKNGIQFLLQGFETADNMSRVIEISLMASGDAIDFPLEKVEALMYVTTPNAAEPSINKCTIKDNKVVYDVLPIVEEGITTMQLKIIEASTDGATGILATPKFAVEVTKSDADDSSAIQTTTFTALEDAMAKAKTVYDERFLRMELSSDCIFRAYYADGTVYETDFLKRLFHNGDVILSESYAHGGTGVRAGEDTDNSMYYSNVSKSEALKAKDIMKNSEAILEEVKLHGVYTAFKVDFESGEIKYVSPSYQFKVNIRTGDLEAIGQSNSFDDEIGRIVQEWLAKNKIILSDLQDISTTHTEVLGKHTTEIENLKKIAESHSENLEALNSIKIEECFQEIERNSGSIKSADNENELYKFKPLWTRHVTMKDGTIGDRRGPYAISPNGRYIAVQPYKSRKLHLYRTSDFSLVGSIDVPGDGLGRIEMDDDFGVVCVSEFAGYNGNTYDRDWYEDMFGRYYYFEYVFFKYTDNSIEAVTTAGTIGKRLPGRIFNSSLGYHISGSQYFWFLTETRTDDDDDHEITYLHCLNKSNNAIVTIKTFVDDAPNKTYNYNCYRIYRDGNDVLLQTIRREYTGVVITIDQVDSDANSNELFHLSINAEDVGTQRFPNPQIVALDRISPTPQVPKAAYRMVISGTTYDGSTYGGLTQVYGFNNALLSACTTSIAPQEEYTRDSLLKLDAWIDMEVLYNTSGDSMDVSTLSTSKVTADVVYQLNGVGYSELDVGAVNVKDGIYISEGSYGIGYVFLDVVDIVEGGLIRVE